MPRSPGRTAGFLIVALLLGLAAAAATAEVAIRLAKPPPRMQIVRLDADWLRLDERDGVPLWWDPVYAHGPIRGEPCRPGQPVVGVASDSVLMSIEPSGDGHRVADELRASLGVCVRDGGRAGYRPYQELAMLRWIDEQTPLSVGILSIWKEDRHYHRFGSSLYDSETVVHDADDFLPLPPLRGLPHGLHRWLFGHARAWEYATIALAEPVWDARDPAGAYLEAIAWASARRLPLILVEAPPLDAPFEQTAAERAELPRDGWLARIEEAARGAGHEYVVLAEALRDEDYREIRLDACCHYNRKGHAAVARVLGPIVARRLAEGSGAVATP
jgi:hypothetical protein